MTKELFVSSTPHETKVGMVEDDLLAEIYLERENEYTLAGSIYKGRVTRVLPGMQSAFVDIGLERDAFLYVSDFMELEDSEDLDDVPTNRPAPERPASRKSQPQAQDGESVLPADSPNHEPARKQFRANRASRGRCSGERAIIARACGDAAGVADAAESAFRNRSLPVRERRRRGRLRVPIFPKAPNARASGTSARPERIDRFERMTERGRTI